ncbi:MAG: hypothetical protein M1818_007255 [Claussenomyces sp. TS43310]|nr:MAG: hypothetical protein M1818_007255 [Claussenomyces sp. TS43310]
MCVVWTRAQHQDLATNGDAIHVAHAPNVVVAAKPSSPTPLGAYPAGRVLATQPTKGFVRSNALTWGHHKPQLTTDPPTLCTSHPLRRAFTNYGREAARHPVITLLISVAISVSLIYPFPFLYTNDFTNGSSNLPHHVWTAAEPFDGDSGTIPDVVMRSVWVHGSYMKALERNVLLAALDIQDDLLGSTVDFDPTIQPRDDLQLKDGALGISQEFRDSLHASHGWGNQSWFFQSPLLYWAGSKQAISEDKDIISTVNEGSRRGTVVNVTLRHSIVFSGKRFEDNRLVAADALVITLFHKQDSAVGKQWEAKSRDLASRAAGSYRIYPSNGWVTASQLYDFRFQPLSVQDDLYLGLTYGLTTLIFLLRLTRIRALKSRIGLTVTVMTQIAVSIMSSFTICAVLNIDLSKIPREAYPVVILTIGLENMFRMINAVIVTPSESPTTARIGEALGTTGHIALAGVGQNLLILWLLYKVVSPGVGAFCVFAAIALSFDFFFLVTFFVAVLSVDVRRTELSDSIDRARRRPRRSARVFNTHTWINSLFRGTVPVSTRLAGTVVMVGFILIAQWHFFEREHPAQTLSRLWRLISMQKSTPASLAMPTENMDVNQARTPTAWLQLQDHETAREVIQIIKPKAHNYIARVYDPLVVVLNGSDRTPSCQGIRLFLPAVYDFVKHQLFALILTDMFLVAAVSLYMNYLLWGEERDDTDDEQRAEDDPLLAVSTLDKGHALDVAALTTSSAGFVVSVGLDRWIRIWDIRNGVKSHVIDTEPTGRSVFPLQAIAIDDEAEWLALASATGHIALWNIRKRRWGPQMDFEVTGRAPIAFTFRLSKTAEIPPLILVHHNAMMLEFSFDAEEKVQASEIKICKSPLICVRIFWDRSSSISSQPLLCIVTASRRGCVHVVTERGGGWISEGIDALDAPLGKGVISVVPLPALQCFLAVRQSSVDLVELDGYNVLRSFETADVVPHSLRCIHSAPRRRQCGSLSLTSFSLVYTCRNTGDCVLRTFSPKREGDVICMGSKRTSHGVACPSWAYAVEHNHRVASPGSWKTLPIGVIVGVNKCEASPQRGLDCKADRATLASGGLRKRGTFLQRSRGVMTPRCNDDRWKAWLLSAKGERMDMSLCEDEESGRTFHLLTPNCGPLARIGQRSIAVGLGNSVKVITVGHERFDGAVDTSENLALAMAGRRRKPPGTKRSCAMAGDTQNGYWYGEKIP